MYGPSCPVRAELSMGRVVHGPSCPGIETQTLFIDTKDKAIAQLETVIKVTQFSIQN